ncbi:MAG: hypothetical protein ACRD2W_05325 [Acidimicrobiales bacterium]
MTTPSEADLRRLLEQAVRRARIGLGDGKSGTVVERLDLLDGSTLVVKHVRPYGDWIMRAMHDEGRAATLWTRGILARLPAGLDSAVLGAVPSGDGWTVVMRDVEDCLLPDETTLSRDQSRRIIAAVHALHVTFAGEDVPGLALLADRYTVLGPSLAERERDGADAVPKMVERGWSIFADRVAPDVAQPVMQLLDDPAELVSTLARRSQTLVHGDLKIPNIGVGSDRVVLLDWGTQTGIAPSAVEWAWYVAISAGRIAARREDILDDVRAAEGDGHDRVALRLSLLGAVLQLGWNKALDAYEHPDASIRARERRDLEWWVRTARGVLENLAADIDMSHEGGAMTDIQTRLAGVRAKLTAAVDAVEDDAGASPVLVAVVREFDAKLGRAETRAVDDTSSNGAVREGVVEAEQAADSAKVAAEADPGVGSEARQAVLDAHYAICVLKAEM